LNKDSNNCTDFYTCKVEHNRIRSVGCGRVLAGNPGPDPEVDPETGPLVGRRPEAGVRTHTWYIIRQQNGQNNKPL